MAALDGMRILDMTQYEAGPSCTQALAWMGADVVKVERPGTGDPSRRGPGGDGIDSEYYINWNSNKRSITLALETRSGRDLLLKLLPGFDVFVENFGPGVVEKLDIGYDVMGEAHPSVIYARIKGFGTSGPYADYKCFDMVAQAAAGAYSVTGDADGPPTQPGPTTGDSGTGVQMALAILAAYVQKMRTGKGQLIEISMQEAMIYYMRTAISTRSNWGKRPAARNGSGSSAPMNIYPCSPFGPNDYISIVAVTPRMHESLCETIGRRDLLADRPFKTGAEYRQNDDALKKAITDWSSKRDKYAAMATLAEAGVPVSAVLDTRDLFNDPHLKARGYIHEIDHPAHGKVPLMGWAPRMSESQVPIAVAPLLGEHTDSVLQEELGLTQAELADLHTSKIV
jgi:formyl-CoA transferase